MVGVSALKVQKQRKVDSGSDLQGRIEELKVFLTTLKLNSSHLALI